MLKFVNISKNSIVTFSSTSNWSTPTDCIDIVNPDISKNFAFHTDIEEKPWILLDLHKKSLINKITISNRKDRYKERVYKLVIEYSNDKHIFNLIKSGFFPFNESLSIIFNKGIVARYIRISLDGRDYFHLSKIEIFSVISKKIVPKNYDYSQQINTYIDGNKIDCNNNCYQNIFQLVNKMSIFEQKLNSISQQLNVLGFINRIVKALFDNAYGYGSLEFYTSQLSADLWVLKQLNFKRNGFFVEFGAFDGFNLSNTYLLEKSFDWNGILAEPNEELYKKVLEYRTCICSSDLISAEDGLKFTFIPDGEFGTIDKYIDCDGHKDHRENFLNMNKNKTKILTSICLNSFLDKYNAPLKIDYMSIDTEGSEYDILSKFDFNKYKVTMFSIEHNYKMSVRSKIFNLMSSHGYKRIRRYWDDWYINYQLLNQYVDINLQ